jgi:hypothetical protein
MNGFLKRSHFRQVCALPNTAKRLATLAGKHFFTPNVRSGNTVGQGGLLCCMVQHCSAQSCTVQSVMSWRDRKRVVEAVDADTTVN